MPSRRPESLAELLQLEGASRTYWSNKLGEPSERLSPEEQDWCFKLMYQMLSLPDASPTALSPQMREMQHLVVRMHAAIEGPELFALPSRSPQQEHLRGHFESLMREDIQGMRRDGIQDLRRAGHLEDVLRPHPQLSHLQSMISRLLGVNRGDPTFDMPALLNAIARHFNRPTIFTRIAELTPSEAELIASLEELHSRKPNVHIQLCQILIQATLIAGPRHNNGCSCPLCSHMARMSHIGASQHGTSTTAPSTRSASH